MINIKNSGKHRVQVMRGGKCIEDTGLFDNLILDGFFDRMTDPNADGFGNNGNANQLCSVGSGTTPAANNDIGLESLLAAQSGSDSVVQTYEGFSAGNFVYSVTRVFSFTLGSVVGNVSEVGTVINTGAPNAGSPLATRAILPTTVTVTAEDQLVVTHVRYVQISGADVTGSVVLDSINYDFTIRFVNAVNANVLSFVVNPNTWAVRAATGTTFGKHVFEGGVLPPAGDSWNGGTGDSSDDSPSIEKITAPNTLTGRVNTIHNPNQSNLTAGIKIMSIMGGSFETWTFFLAEFIPNIPKGSSERLTLEVQINHSRA